MFSSITDLMKQGSDNILIFFEKIWVPDINWLEELCHQEDKTLHISNHGQFLTAKINFSTYHYISLESLLFQLSIDIFIIF